MSVLDRSALEASPLADLHAVASELSIDGYRRLRRAELISAILDKQGGGEGVAEPEEAPAAKPTRSRARRTPAAAPETAEEAEEDQEDEEEEERPGARRRRSRRGGRGRSQENGAPATPAAPAQQAETDSGDEVVEGVVELLGGGSGFVRVNPPEPSDEDVYISSAQVKRCELVSGDRVSGPKRAPRRSERFASLIRIETINGRPASELADSVRFDDLPARYPDEVLKLDSDDATLKAIDGLTPFGKGSRVAIVGPGRAGKTEALKRIAATLAERDDVQVQLVLAGARPEEISEWSEGPVKPAASASLTASEDAQNGAVESVVDQARRLAARGADAVVLIDSLDGCSPGVARRALGAARKIADGGSLTVIATAAAPVGGETTVVALDAVRTANGRLPALDLELSGVLRPDVLLGATGAKALGRAREKAVKAAEK